MYSTENIIKIEEMLHKKGSTEESEILKATSLNDVSLSNGIVASKLCIHTDDVCKINKSELEKLPGQLKTFNDVDSDPPHWPITSTVTLRQSQRLDSRLAYVVLSRAKSLASVRITNFSPSCIRADSKVLRFYRDLRITTPVVKMTLA